MGSLLTHIPRILYISLNVEYVFSKGQELKYLTLEILVLFSLFL